MKVQGSPRLASPGVHLPGINLSEHNMSPAWVASSIALPPEGESVEFVLDGREVAMDGTYTHQTFQSRWSGYDVQRVRSWRPVGIPL